MQGKTINGFELKRLLGMGGMAEVWYAENEIGLKAAVKILSEELSHNAQMQERFLNEAKVMVKLDHPNIRKVHGYGSIDGRPAIIMEYLDGSDLKKRMKDGQRFTDEEMKRWWNQMVDALSYTHAQGIVHRDIKPSNIFIDQKGNAKLLDFGIAKVADTTTGTLTGSTLGTRIYMSPEQVKDPKRVGTASDVYSLAVSFVHLLTGKAPYDSTTSSDYDIQVSIVTKPVDVSKVPVEWRGFLAPFLTKEPADRPVLRTFVATTATPPDEDDGTIDDEAPKRPKQSPTDKPSTVIPHSGLDPLSPALNDKPKSRKGLWIGLAAAAVAAMVVVLVILQPKKALVSTNFDTQVNDVVNRMSIVIDPWNWVTCNENNRKNTAKQIVVVNINDQFQYFVDENAADESHLADLIKERINDYNRTVVVLQYDKTVPVHYIVHVIDALTDIAQRSGALYVDFGLPSGRLWTLDSSSKTMINNAVAIYIDENCQCFVNDTQVLEEYQLKELINTKIVDDPLCAVVIRTDKVVPVWYIVNVIDTVIEINNVTGNNHNVIIATSTLYDGEQPLRPVGI